MGQDRSFSRRAMLGFAAAVIGGRALGGCGGPDVSIRIRRVDGTVQGTNIVVRASVVYTNHKNEARTVPMRMTLSAPGESPRTLERTLNIAAAEFVCICHEVTVVGGAFGTGGATLTITAGEESATATLAAFGATPLQSCDYTCNY